MQWNEDALFFASAELQADREVVLAAVQQHGSALVYASSELRAGRDFVLAAVCWARLSTSPPLASRLFAYRTASHSPFTNEPTASGMPSSPSSFTRMWRLH